MPTVSTERTTVDLDAAVAAARAMIGVDGESALTMRRLADRLGLSPMAIYRHVADRDELIDLALDSALADCRPGMVDDLPWQDQLISYFRRFWLVMTLEPGLGAVAITRPMQGPNMGRITDDLLQICRRAGVADHAFVIIDSLLLTTLGAVAYDISRPTTARKGIATTDETVELDRRQDSYGERDPSEYFTAAMQTVMVGLETRMARGDLPRP